MQLARTPPCGSCTPRLSLPLSLSFSLFLSVKQGRSRVALSDMPFYRFFSWCFACIWMIMAHIVPARVTDWTAWQWKCIQDSVCCRLLYVLSPFEHNFERICVRLFSEVKEDIVEFLTSVGIGCFYPDLMGIESDFCLDFSILELFQLLLFLTYEDNRTVFVFCLTAARVSMIHISS